jgi:hypothetical protein
VPKSGCVVVKDLQCEFPEKSRWLTFFLSSVRTAVQVKYEEKAEILKGRRISRAFFQAPTLLLVKI